MDPFAHPVVYQISSIRHEICATVNDSTRIRSRRRRPRGHRSRPTRGPGLGRRTAIHAAATVITAPTARNVSGGPRCKLTIPAMYAYVSDLHPTSLRASGFGWASSVESQREEHQAQRRRRPARPDHPLAADDVDQPGRHQYAAADAGHQRGDHEGRVLAVALVRLNARLRPMMSATLPQATEPKPGGAVASRVLSRGVCRVIDVKQALRRPKTRQTLRTLAPATRGRGGFRVRAPIGRRPRRDAVVP